MHAGVGDHVVIEHLPVSDEPWVVVMAASAGTDAVVATRAPVEVYHHRGRSVDEAVLDQELHHRRIDRLSRSDRAAALW